jgi:hypothetical protein
MIRFDELPAWHRVLLTRLLTAEFPGCQELLAQVQISRFRLIDENQSLEIQASADRPAPVLKTIPVEAWARDQDGIWIQSLLFTRSGLAYMLDNLRVDGKPIVQLPPAEAFAVLVTDP